MDKISELAGTLFGYSFHVGKLELNIAGVLAAALTLLLVWALSRLMQKGFTRYAMGRQAALRPAIYTVSRLAKYILVVIGVLVAAGLMGVPLTQFAGARRRHWRRTWLRPAGNLQQFRFRADALVRPQPQGRRFRRTGIRRPRRSDRHRHPCHSHHDQ
jgi:hypothetical protein